jgi:hypothetical protein
LIQALEDKKKLERENQELNETLRSVVTTKKKGDMVRKNTPHELDNEVGCQRAPGCVFVVVI